MANPVLYARISFDDASDASPAWLDVSSRVRSFRIDGPGRSSELEDVQPAVATVVLSDPDGDFIAWNRMSVYAPNVVSNRRLWRATQSDVEPLSTQAANSESSEATRLISLGLEDPMACRFFLKSLLQVGCVDWAKSRENATRDLILALD